MREIKFRVLCERSNTMFFIGLGHTYKDLYDTKIMQYTGLKDKNGVEIYEGDIVKIQHPYYGEVIGYVLYRACNFKFSVDFLIGQLEESINLSNDIDFEVIGNIYENSELLK